MVRLMLSHESLTPSFLHLMSLAQMFPQYPSSSLPDILPQLSTFLYIGHMLTSFFPCFIVLHLRMWPQTFSRCPTTIVCMCWLEDGMDIGQLYMGKILGMQILISFYLFCVCIISTPNPSTPIHICLFNTQYKTWEFQLYTFVIAPILLYGILPTKYWSHYCQLVRGFQIICQYSLIHKQLKDAHTLFCVWQWNFKLFYYQLRHDHIHFVRPAVHQVIHLVPEAFQKGPSICYAQWTME